MYPKVPWFARRNPFGTLQARSPLFAPHKAQMQTKMRADAAQIPPPAPARTTDCRGRAYLRNIFYRLEQKSPQQYLIGVRIERAKALLKTKNATISEIAASVGYQDPIQFYKIFKKHTGISATQYQKDSLYTEH